MTVLKKIKSKTGQMKATITASQDGERETERRRRDLPPTGL
jgi:hypothetical protein